MTDHTEKDGFTPGPWRVIRYDAGDVDHLSGVPSVVAADELDCTIVHWNGFKQRFWQSARGDREMLANAHLIAAAPELYAVAEEQARKPCETTSNDDMETGCCGPCRARAALSQASPTLADGGGE